MPHEISQSVEIQTCIGDCQECWRMCTETVQHCLQKGGRRAEADHILLLLDCAEVCRRCAESCKQISNACV